MLISTNDITLFVYIYVFCFLGAFSKDMLDTFLEKIPKVLILKVLISSLSVAVLLYGLSEYLLDKISFKFLSAICFVLGVLSFEGMTKYSSIQDIDALVKKIYRIKYHQDDDKT